MRILIKCLICTLACASLHGGENGQEQPVYADNESNSFLEDHSDSLTDGGLDFLLEIKAVNDDEMGRLPAESLLSVRAVKDSVWARIIPELGPSTNIQIVWTPLMSSLTDRRPPVATGGSSSSSAGAAESSVTGKRSRDTQSDDDHKPTRIEPQTCEFLSPKYIPEISITDRVIILDHLIEGLTSTRLQPASFIYRSLTAFRLPIG